MFLRGLATEWRHRAQPKKKRRGGAQNTFSSLLITNHFFFLCPGGLPFFTGRYRRNVFVDINGLEKMFRFLSKTVSRGLRGKIENKKPTREGMGRGERESSLASSFWVFLDGVLGLRGKEKRFKVAQNN